MGAVPPPPVASPLGVGGGVPPCVEECAKLREEVQKRGLAAKPAGQLKARREEMCTYVGAYSAPELKMGQVHRSQCHELRHSGWGGAAVEAGPQQHQEDQGKDLLAQPRVGWAWRRAAEPPAADPRAPYRGS